MQPKPKSKRAKVLLRTAIGTGLVAVLVLLAWLLSRDPTGWTLIVTTGLLTVLAVLECRGMARRRALTSGAAGTLVGLAALTWIIVSALGVEGSADSVLGPASTLFGGLQPAHATILSSFAALALLGASGGWILRAIPGHELLLVGLCVAVLALGAGLEAFEGYTAGLIGTFRWPAVLLSTYAVLRGMRPKALARSALEGLWCGLPLLVLWCLWRHVGTSGLMAFVALSKIGDIAGYYCGNAFGKHHPFKRLSPGKTTEGCLGSLAGGMLAGALMGQAGLLFPGAAAPLAGLAFGAAINIAAQAGDLFESSVKRAAKVKDSGPWFGPAGGGLDLVDSFLFTVPTAVFLWDLLAP